MLGIFKRHIFLIILCLLQLSWSAAISAQEQESDQQKVQKFKAEAQEIYMKLNISSIVDFPSFAKAYVAFYKLRVNNRLNNKPIISFLNHSMKNTEARFVTVDVVNIEVRQSTRAGSGVNSYCKNSCIGQGCCTNTSGKPAL
jgi:hypothetical protein